MRWRPASLAPERRAAILARAVDAQRDARCIESFVALAEEELGGATGPASCVAAARESRAFSAITSAQPLRALVHLRALADEPTCDDRDRAELLAALRSAGAHGELADRLAKHLQHHPE